MDFSDGRELFRASGRVELFRSLVGSHNYNLATPESDRDYKVFVLPTFDDLYNGTQFSKSYIGETEDYDVHDVRKVSHLWWKANINFIEVLFSEEIIINPNISLRTKSLLYQIFGMKGDIARMNLPYLYDACIGMHITKKSQIDKGTQGTQHLVDQFGYDTKQAMHSLRVLDFLAVFCAQDFKDFKRAIWYDKGKSILLNLKAGKYTKEEYLEICGTFMTEAMSCKEAYKSQEPLVSTKDMLESLIKDMVKGELL